ncbi:hypothetical protein DFH28DRAFT_1122889 [Melampsora americana]|nr:hypothetical protein DFH28DRAFT_1122889 [Melampsora americana]
MELNQVHLPVNTPQVHPGHPVPSNNELPSSPSPAQFLSTHASNSPMILVEQSNRIGKALDDIIQSIASIAKLQIQLQHVNADRYVDTSSILSGLVNPLNENIASFDSNLDVIEKFVKLAMAVVRRDMRRAHMISLSQMQQDASRRMSSELSKHADLGSNLTVPQVQQDGPSGANEQVKMEIEMQQNLPAEALTIDTARMSLPTDNHQSNPEGDQSSIRFKDTVNTMKTQVDLSHSDTVMDPNAPRATQDSNVNSVSQATQLHSSLDPMQPRSIVPDPVKRSITQINDHSTTSETLVASLMPGNQTPIIIDDESGPVKKKTMIDLISPSPSPVPPINNPGAPIKISDNDTMSVLTPAPPIGATSSEPPGPILAAGSALDDSSASKVEPVSTAPLTGDPPLSALPEAASMETGNVESKSKSGSSESADGDLFGDGSLFGSNNNSALPSPLNPLAPSPVIPPHPEPRSILDLSSFLANSVPSGSSSDPAPIGLPVDISAFLSNYTSETGNDEKKEMTETKLDKAGISAQPASSPGLPSADPSSLFTPSSSHQVSTIVNPNPVEGNLVDLQSLGVDLDSLSNFLSSN